MTNADYAGYCALYGAEITETEFNRISYDVERFMDAHTTGIDNVHKLEVAFPSNERDANAVIRCFYVLIHTQHEIDALVEKQSGADGHGAIASMSSGSESVSYARTATYLDVAATDMGARAKLFNNIMHNYLSGVQDDNGVNILYMGEYP